MPPQRLCVRNALGATTEAHVPVQAVEGVWRLCFCEGGFLDGIEVDNHGYVGRYVLPEGSVTV